jgi:hypothetical protein
MIDLIALRADVARQVEEAGARYHELRGQLKLVNELIKQQVRAQAEQPVYTDDENPPAPAAECPKNAATSVE